MPRPRSRIGNAFNVPVKKSNPARQGYSGFDNARENIDPRIVTKSLNSVELNLPEFRMYYDRPTETIYSVVKGTNIIERNHNTEVHRVTNFIFKPLGSGITWSNYGYAAAANLNFFRANGTEGSETTTENGNILHRTKIWGYHTDQYYQGAEQRYTINSPIGGTPEVPTRWSLHLVGDSSTTLNEVARTTATEHIIKNDFYFEGTGSGLPYGEIYYHDGGTALVMAAQDTYYQFLGFTDNGVSNNTTPDYTNGHITINKTGIYKLALSLSSRCANAIDFEANIHLNNSATQIDPASIHFTTVADAKSVHASTTTLVSLTAGDTVELWVQRTTGAAISKTLTVDLCVLNVIHIGG